MYLTTHNETLLDHRIWCKYYTYRSWWLRIAFLPISGTTFTVYYQVPSYLSVSSSTHINTIYSWYTSHIHRCRIIIMTRHIPRFYKVQKMVSILLKFDRKRHHIIPEGVWCVYKYIVRLDVNCLLPRLYQYQMIETNKFDMQIIGLSWHPVNKVYFAKDIPY